MRFLSFNIRYDNPADGVDAWPHRVASVAALLAQKLPDVFGLQEAQHHQIEDLQRALQLDYAWVGVGRDDGREAGEYTPVFYRSSVLTLQDSGTFWHSDTPDQPGSRFEGSAFPRTCTWARLQRGGDKPFFFFNTHFDYLQSAVQERSAALMLARVSALAGLYPAVLVGDLNCTPESAARRRLASSFFVDTRERAAALPPDRNVNPGAGTFTGFRDAGRAAAVLPGEETIDHIFTSGFALERREVSLEVRRDGGRSISDHRALWVDASIEV